MFFSLWGAMLLCAWEGSGESGIERVLVCQEGSWVWELAFCYSCSAVLEWGCIARQVYWMGIK